MAETIGSLMDKSSIMALKIYHMQEQVDRTDAPPEHREACQRRVEIMKQQVNDLAEELNELAEALFQRKKELKVYRQFKMYNDPIYRSK